MMLKYVLLLLSVCAVYPQRNDVTSESEAKPFIKLTALGYEDACLDATDAYWTFVNNPTNETLLQWNAAQQHFMYYKRNETQLIITGTNFSIDEPSVRYSFALARNPGDALLNATQWERFVSFTGQIEILRLASPETFESGPANAPRQDVELLLSGNSNADDKQKTWSEWHERYRSYVQNFSDNLGLITEAAAANGFGDIETYWKSLSEYQEGYERIESIWSEISTLHSKLQEFVANRLKQKYKFTTEKGLIPAHLLGSLDGYDWTHLLSDVAPYGDVAYSIRKNMLKKNLFGSSLYKSASSLSKVVLNEVPEANFWAESRFNNTCPTHLVNFCKYGNMRVSTCQLASVSNFLTAHKVVGEVLTNQMNYENEPILRIANRYSPLEYGVGELLSILSASPGQLKNLGLVGHDTDSEHLKITSLLITALDVLPRLAYYASADSWRLDAINNHSTSPEKLQTSWWQRRARDEHIATSVPDMPSFLNDDFITSNKPYLPKFVAGVLAFQLYEHMTQSTATRSEKLTKSEIDKDLITMVRESGASEWTTVLYKRLEISGDDISPDALISFFAPLDNFLTNPPDDLHSMNSAQETELRKLEELYRAGLATSTTPKPRVTTASPKISSKTNPKSESETDKRPPIVVEPPRKKYNFSIHAVPTEPNDSESTETDQLNTSKAVWAVAAVLIAIIVICIVAIFGRRRCVQSQTPKNRRYV